MGSATDTQSVSPPLAGWGRGGSTGARVFPLLAAALVLATPAGAMPPTGPARLFTGADLFGIEAVADPQISPDGSKVAYVRRSNDIMTDRTRSTIWLIDVKSGEQIPIAAGPGANVSPRWSPDGRRLAYIAAADGGAAQLFVRWMADGATARITGMPDTPGSIAWSPDGTTIAYLLTVPDAAPQIGAAPAKPEGASWAPPLQVITSLVYRSDGGGYAKPGTDHIFVVAADGGSPRQLTFGDQDDNGPLSWAPDGSQILFSSNRGKDAERETLDSEVFTVDVRTAEARPLTDRRGPDASPTVSPDGRWIAWLGFDDRRLGYQSTELSVMHRDGSEPRVLTAGLDRSVGSPRWSADSKAISVQYDDHGGTRVARIGLDGSIRTIATGLVQSEFDRPYTGGDYSLARDGTLAFTGGRAERPADLFVARGGRARQLTHLNDELFYGKALGMVAPLAVTAPDGRPIDAWLVTPAIFDPAKKYPLILEIHGGPFAAYGPSFSTDDQLYAAAGYVVLYVNPRGSTSYGAAFANLIHHAYPGDDYGDLMAAVDTAIARGFVDPDNLFVTGGSGGGVLTSWIVGKTDRFRAAVAQKPVIDWSSFVLTSDQTPYFARYWFGKFPWEDPQAYWSRSPLSLVGSVRTPTMVVVGSEDYRTPVSEAEQYYTALRLRGVPTALVKVPGASHGGLAARPSQSAARVAAILAWFDRFRKR